MTATEHSGVDTQHYICTLDTVSFPGSLSLIPENEVVIASPFLDCLAPEHEHCKEREPGNETEVIVNEDTTIIGARVGKPSLTLSKNAKCKVGVCVSV